MSKEVREIFKNKYSDGKLNICGEQIKRLRKEKHISQRVLSDNLQLMGIDLGKNAIQQIESRNRFVTDIELKILAQYFEITVDELLGNK